MVSLEKDVTDKVASEKQLKKEVPDSESHVPHQAPDNGATLLPSDDNGSDRIPNDGVTPLLQSDDKGSPQPVTPSKAFQVPEGAVAALQSLQEGSNSSLTSEKASLTPESGALVLQSGQEGSTSSRVRERPLEDGYNWRKYGQKLVRGNIFVRSYYRCTHPKCPVKRQVERSHKGQVTDTVYFGQHEHPKPQLRVPIAVGFAVSAGEEKAEVPLLTSVEDTPLEAHKGNTSTQIEPGVPLQHPSVSDSEGVEGMLSLSNRTRDGEPDSKRHNRKKEKQNGNTILVDKPTNEPCEQREPRVVVQTMSEVDIVSDGYRWRKYGQKLVKGNPNPRSYYRCSNPGCPVKKHVERAVNDSKVVIATYEGQHDHDIPPSRIVTPNPAASNVHFIDSCTKSEENDVSRALVVHTNPEHEVQPVEQPSGDLRTKSQRSDDAASNMVVDSDLVPERKVDEHLIGKAIPKEACETPAILRRANKVQNGDSESIPTDQEKRKPAEPVRGEDDLLGGTHGWRVGP